MREKTLLIGALAATACAAVWGISSSVSSSNGGVAAVHVVTVDVDPRDANVTVNGVRVLHPRGTFELRGSLGNVFVVEVQSEGARVVERIAITDVGAFPSSIEIPSASIRPLPVVAAPVAAPLPEPVAPPVAEVPPPPVVPEGLPVAAAPNGCATTFWFDAQGIKHFKPQCLPPPSRPTASGVGSLTVVCMPKCDQVIDNDIALGPGHIFNRPVSSGRHVLTLSAPNGVKKNLVVDVVADQTKEVRMSMDGPRALQPRSRTIVDPGALM